MITPHMGTNDTSGLALIIQKLLLNVSYATTSMLLCQPVTTRQRKANIAKNSSNLTGKIPQNASE